jgi:Lrp/AsnC family transcriptional regulator for asnA, asnC and gidA
MASLDKIDHKILNYLIEDGRIAFSAVAKDIGLTDVATKKRIDSLFKKGIIERITAILNLKALGFENPIFISIRTEMPKTADIVKRLMENDFVTELYQTLGEYNIMAKILVRDLEEAKRFVEQLQSIEGILDVKSTLVLSPMKKSYSLPPETLQKKL